MNSTQKMFPLITDANQDNLNMLAQALEKIFGRSFVLRVHERDNGALHLQAAEQDTGNDYMTPHDLACLLQTDVKSVCRQTETRAQQRAKFPMPFFKLNGKLRFERKKIQEWLQNIANSAPTFKPAKRGRPRKTKLQ